MASFEAYNPLLQQVEGGFQKIAADPGNYNSLGQLVGTNFGISARFYEGIIKRPPTEADMRSITKSEAKGLFKIHFWNKCQADLIRDQYVANTIVDHHINSGGGIKLAQQVLNKHFGYNMSVDNAMGPITLNAVNSVSPQQFTRKFNEARADYYRKIGNQTFIEGWLIRLKKFGYNNKAATLSLGAIAIIGSFFFAMYKLNN